MVLEDVDNSAPDSFNDNPDASTNDPYASASPPSGQRFDPSSFPQPFPILGTFMGFSETAVQFKTETTLQFAEKRLSRPLYPDEAQALASHIYELEQTKSYYAAAGFAAGTYRCWSTAAEMRYPFYKPKLDTIDRNKFGGLRGPMAMFARHAWRFSLYALVAGQMGSIIGQMIAQPIVAAKSAKDPRLEQFSIDLKAASQVDSQRTSQAGRDYEQRRRDFEEQVKNRSGGGPSPQARWGRQPAAKKEDPVDDMSPTAGNEAWGSQSPTPESWETFSNDTSQPAPQRQQNPPTENWNRRPQPNRPAQAPSLPFDDDASPTGGLFQDEVNSAQSQSQPPSRPGESAWDRLRRGGAPVPGQRAPPPSRRPEPERREQRETSTLGDSYTFVEGDDERKRAKQQAQQEFDARLERERQGRDFSSNDDKRW
ncbi:hypothetical protein T440DRAFT_384639 [Plenodomus tracheiphilus IPT5]|uniref:Uncharacterized protein n=1 Tax=Plenodomus tracheiphilus IPT5 TaxID=1408161 RepID=A0A6A7BPJ2_9PLEO|nr:hypothetical protein T440DRAFT_384639 [Plenodomus tracheiphilus IPT5]